MVSSMMPYACTGFKDYQITDGNQAEKKKHLLKLKKIKDFCPRNFIFEWNCGVKRVSGLKLY